MIGALGTLQLLDASTRANFRAEESQTLNNRLQAELEEVKRLPFTGIALTSQPSHSGDSNDPRWRVNGSNFAISSNGGQLKPLVVDAQNGAVDPGPEPFQVGDISGEIFKFIVWHDDPSCPENLCPGAQDLKQIIVAAKVNQSPISFERSFQEVHSEVADPEATPVDNPAPEGSAPEEENAVGQLWITDTPCSYSSHQETVAGGPAHNTGARCEDGLHTGTSPGAPDLMFDEGPELDPDYPSDQQPMFDYAIDAEPSVGGDQDAGLLMPWSTNDSCLLEPVLSLADLRQLVDGQGPLAAGVDIGTNETDGILGLVTGESSKHLRAHTWLTPAITNTDPAPMSGNATLELWTKTVNGAAHPGRICVSLFVRRTLVVPTRDQDGNPIGTIELTIDLPVVNTDPTFNPALDPDVTYFEYSDATWPTEWTEISVPMEFLAVDGGGALEPLHLEQGSQLGMTAMVKKSGTEPGAALEFMYDHPSFESRLEVESESILRF